MGRKILAFSISPGSDAGYEPVRRAIDTLEEWCLVTLRTPVMVALGRPLENAWLRRLTHLVNHLVLGWRIRQRAREKFVFAQEFITIPLLVSFPLWARQRRRVVFQVNHNVQFAMRSRGQRLALNLLFRLGARIAAHEIFLRDLPATRLRPRHDLMLPNPMASRTFSPRRRDQRLVRVGLVGSFRPEQQGGETLAFLSGLGPVGGREPHLVVASANRARLEEMKAKAGEIRWYAPGSGDYWDILAGLDVVVLNYLRSAYEYRTSGVAADAIACGVPVVAPDFPLIRRQLLWPVPMGRTFSSPDEIAGAIDEVVRWDDAYLARGAERHHEERGEGAFRRLLQGISSTQT
jgi:glycosyltransferase involved in cell wall biosynthesis